ncbi:MAG: LAGLIDADG family homing endonuclease [Candidatus Ranarchaeia archaeon]
MGYSIKVTPNHRILIKRDKKELLLPAKEILVRDRIATIGRIPFSKFTQPSVNEFILENRTSFSNVKFDPEISYFLGLMLGDGYSGAEMNKDDILYKGTAQIVNTDKAIIESSKRIGRKFKLSYREYKNVYGTPVLSLSKTKWFREFLVRAGVDVGDRKHIAKSLMLMNLENTTSLLRGLFDSDGYVSGTRSIGFANTSETLIRQVQKQLLRFGIVSGIRRRKGSVIKYAQKKYSTKPSYELRIMNKECILRFHERIGFGIQKKQKSLDHYVSHIQRNVHYIECPDCNYTIYGDLFSGRTSRQKEWGKQKLEIIKLLGFEGELSSNEITKKLGFIPRLGETRLNHHYELIKKRRISLFPSRDWLWSLNNIGKWIFDKKFTANEEFIEILKLNECPLCGNPLDRILKKGWRYYDFDGDIYWDFVKDIQRVPSEQDVFDVVLPNTPDNDHMFISNGFVVHNSAGVNLPAKTAIIRDYKRFESGIGSYPIPVLEYKQMCFPQGTQVETLDGNKPIEYIGIGDRVVSFDPERKKFVLPRVLKTLSRKAPLLIRICLEQGMEVNTTPEHPFFTKTGWVPAKGLRSGDVVGTIPTSAQSMMPMAQPRSRRGKVRGRKRGSSGGEVGIDFPVFQKIHQIEEIDREVDVFNLTVEAPNSFLANGFLVHNCGRAGRPKYDKIGYSVLLAKSVQEKQFLLRRYVNGETEKIWSKLASEPALRTHMLAAIATDFATTRKGLYEFINTTFYAQQYDVDEIDNVLDKVLQFLIEEGLVIPKKQDLVPTDFGKKVSALYLDPLGAVSIREALFTAERQGKKLNPLAVFQVISHTPDMPSLYLRRKEAEELHTYILENEDDFLLPVPDQWSHPAEYEFFLAEVKTARLCLDWIDEVGEDKIHNRYNAGSGDIHRIVSTADWLVYSMGELAKLFKTSEATKPIVKLRTRIAHGCKEELLPLVQIRGIGRVRGRILYDRGYTTPTKLRQADPKKLATLPTFGPELTKNILDELGKELDEEEWVRLKTKTPGDANEETPITLESFDSTDSSQNSKSEDQ